MGNADPEHDQIGVRCQSQRDMAMAGPPGSTFILVEAQFALGLFEANLNWPTPARNENQVGQSARRRCVGMIVADVFRCAQPPSRYQPMGTADFAMVG